MNDKEIMDWEMQMALAVNALTALTGVHYGSITVNVRDGKPTGVVKIEATLKLDIQELLEKARKFKSDEEE